MEASQDAMNSRQKSAHFSLALGPGERKKVSGMLGTTA